MEPDQDDLQPPAATETEAGGRATDLAIVPPAPAGEPEAAPESVPAPAPVGSGDVASSEHQHLAEHRSDDVAIAAENADSAELEAEPPRKKKRREQRNLAPELVEELPLTDEVPTSSTPSDGLFSDAGSFPRAKRTGRSSRPRQLKSKATSSKDKTKSRRSKKSTSAENSAEAAGASDGGDSFEPPSSQPISFASWHYSRAKIHFQHARNLRRQAAGCDKRGQKHIDAIFDRLREWREDLRRAAEDEP
jgi:hypothetical protein